MIEEARFKEFKALRDVTVRFEPLTVIVGPNSAGKTSILEGTHYAVQLAKKSKLSEVLKGTWRPENLRTMRATDPMELGITGRWGPDTGSLDLSVTFETDEESAETTYKARLSATWNDQVAIIDDFDAQGGLSAKPEMQPLRKALGGVMFLRLSARQLAAPSFPEEKSPFLKPDGQGLASVLTDLASSAPKNKASIETALRSVVPSILQVRTERTVIRRVETDFIQLEGQRFPRTMQREYVGDRVVLDTTSGEGIPIELASEGTILTLGLLTVLYGRVQPRLILLDDIDRALHPKAQGDLIACLRQILRDHEGLQIVATSHAPYLLDELRFEEVRLTTLREDGSVACAELTEHPEYERWKDHVRPGELWTSTAEDWILKQKERST